MHIPDAYLSPATEAAAYAVMIPVWTIATRKTVRSLNTKQAPLLSIGAAFCFAIQMFNIPAVGGTTAHALGATLLAILVGPWAALLGMTLTLTVQALLFGDGGILSLGANSFDMGFVACFVGYGVYRLLRGNGGASTRSVVAAGFSAYAGTVAASLCAGLFLGIQPGIAHDAAGHALYCPFGLNVAVPAMVVSHLLVAGPAEAIITVASLAYLWRTFPEFGPSAVATRPKIGVGLRLARNLIWVLVLTPIGLIAGGSAFGEWDVDELAKLVGYTPSGLAKAHEVVHPLLPDYGFRGLDSTPWAVIGYLASAVVGCAVIALFTRSLLRPTRLPLPAAQKDHASPSAEPLSLGRGQGEGKELPKSTNPGRHIPTWLTQPNPTTPITQKAQKNWLEKTLLKMRATVAKTIASEEIARRSGLLQSVDPLAKTIGFLCALIATGLSQSPAPLIAFIAVTLIAAKLSKIDLKPFIANIAGSVAFFGLVLAIPVSLRSVTNGPAAFDMAGITVSTTGLHAAEMILLRLASGIGLAMLWNLTTRWNRLLNSLKSVGVSRVFLSTAALTYRYLFVMMETLAEMVQARTIRQVGACDKKQARVYAGNGTAILFAKSLAFTEEMHLAMQARSVSANTPESRHRWRAVDVGAMVAGFICLAVIVLQGNIHAF